MQGETTFIAAAPHDLPAPNHKTKNLSSAGGREGGPPYLFTVEGGSGQPAASPSGTSGCKDSSHSGRNSSTSNTVPSECRPGVVPAQCKPGQGKGKCNNRKGRKTDPRRTEHR